jgi:hypothetical protein
LQLDTAAQAVVTQNERLGLMDRPLVTSSDEIAELEHPQISPVSPRLSTPTSTQAVFVGV